MILSEKHQMMQKLFRDFAEKEFTPELLDEIEETGEFNWEIFKKMAKYDITRLRVPKEYGGVGADSLAYVLLIEEFARISPVLSIYANTSNSLAAGPLLYCGTEEQKKEFLGPVARGEKIFVFGLTEPGAGSDAGGMLTTAVEDGDEYVLNGRKTFISGAPFADYAIIYARTDKNSKGSRGISMFIVDMKLPGVSTGKPEKKMGIIGYPTSDVVLENVRVPKKMLLGPLHKGFQTAMKTLDGGRLGMAAQALGIAQGCLEESIKYAKERKQFGRPIGQFQGIGFMIANMATEIEACRQLIYDTAIMKDAGAKDASVRCSMCKLFAGELANRAAYNAVQIHGGYGYIKDYKVERMYRDARITTIYEGTSQVQQVVISGSLLK